MKFFASITLIKKVVFLLELSLQKIKGSALKVQSNEIFELLFFII